MLSHLSVNNFALIEKANLELQNDFTVITGETGSGKSILLGALKLILGERADYSVIRDRDKKTIVEAVFNIDNPKIKAYFDNNDWDFETETIIRREINANGKSRAFINDSPVQLAALKELTEQLIHIHSQHHTLELRKTNFQREILDVIGEHQALLHQVSSRFKKVKELTQEIEALEDKKSKIALEHDFNSFQLEELEKLQLDTLDYEKIESEVELAEHFEEIKENYAFVATVINDEEGVIDRLQKIVNFSKVEEEQLLELKERIQSVLIELKDVADVAEDKLSDMHLNPEELHQNTLLLDAYNNVLKKHNLHQQSELRELMENLLLEVDNAEGFDEKIKAKKLALEQALKEAKTLATELSKKRKNVAKSIESSIANLLNLLKLEGATIQFKFKEANLQAHGADEINLYFAPNKGMEAQPIEKAASGGELSRLMLAIQFLLSQKQQLPTVIFDEIDTGVSGEVAQKIGEHLKKMGKYMQIIAITHLPQVASKGASHILVEKSEKNNKTETSFKNLNTEERIKEIAKLMSGSTINEAALLNAKSLMNE